MVITNIDILGNFLTLLAKQLDYILKAINFKDNQKRIVLRRKVTGLEWG